MLLYWHLLFVSHVLSEFVNPRRLNAGGCDPDGFVAPLQPRLADVRTASVNVTGSPIGVVYDLSGDFAYFGTASSSVMRGAYLGVLNTTNPLSPQVIQYIDLVPPGAQSELLGPTGLALSTDGKRIYVAAGPGSFIVDAAKAKTGQAGAVIGFANGTTSTERPGGAAFAVSPLSDDRYIFVAQEYGASQQQIPQMAGTGNIDFFRLGNASSNGSVPATPIGFLNFGYAVAGATLSPDGQVLYVSSEAADPSGTLPGYVSVVNVSSFERNVTTVPRGVLSSVSAGCSAVRTIVSADGSIVWSTARGSNLLVAFNATRMISDPASALLAIVETGTAPVGLTFAKNGTRILVADSARFSPPNPGGLPSLANGTSGISVINVRAALTGRKANLGSIPTGYFPREFALSPDGRTALVSLTTSHQIQAIDVSTLP